MRSKEYFVSVPGGSEITKNHQGRRLEDWGKARCEARGIWNLREPRKAGWTPFLSLTATEPDSFP